MVMGKSFIKKPWCTFGLMPHSVGRVVADRGNSVDILYADGQLYPAESWDARYVRRFGTPEEAIAHMLIYVSDPATVVVSSFHNNFGEVKVDVRVVEGHRKRVEREQKTPFDERHEKWKREREVTFGKRLARRKKS